MTEQEIADAVAAKFREFLMDLTSTEREYLADAFEDAFFMTGYSASDAAFEAAFDYLEQERIEPPEASK